MPTATSNVKIAAEMCIDVPVCLCRLPKKTSIPVYKQYSILLLMIIIHLYEECGETC